jgi:hypothetical protein
MLNKTKIECKCGQIKIQLFSFEIWQCLQGGKKTEYSEYRRAWMQQQQQAASRLGDRENPSSAMVP